MVFKLEHTSKSPRELGKTVSPEFHPIRSSNSVGLGEDLECSFQTSSQMKWRLLVQGPHWETTALVVLGQDPGIGCF